MAVESKYPPAIEVGVYNPENSQRVEETQSRRINKVAKGALNLAKSLWNSKIFKAVVTVVVVAALLAHPVGWAILALKIIACASTYLLILGSKANCFQKITFEFSTIQRLCKSKDKNYGEIQTSRSNKLFLGALPNRIRNEGKHLATEKGIGAVLSINEPWERDPDLLSLPHDKQDWEELNVTYGAIDAKDHHYLSFKALHQAADFICEQLSEENVYVHCRAGVGRSAMAVAAYLIKYEGKNADQAAQIIQEGRPSSTISKKLEDKKHKGRTLEKGLNSFAEKCKKEQTAGFCVQDEKTLREAREHCRAIDEPA